MFLKDKDQEALSLMSNDLNSEVLDKYMPSIDPNCRLGNPDLPTCHLESSGCKSYTKSNVYLIQRRSFKTLREDIRKRISYTISCGF
ncbi:hypothetical protein AVEN_57098-1 [Araneus ventricosus]|uniref:Uncharacterized protein n=1 Tax=Araneus ventricosus TaxID=182803 RepID=A0A4Y2VF49_ARAVE|nr:hypothetical protein AVEN_57098-1 [Araneus ventricosus]